jgi:two-component system osmolarity sensor histidine kinase EnvZ
MKKFKQLLPDSLLGRSLLILILPFALTMMIGIFVFFDRHWSTTTYRLADSLAGEVALIVETWEQESDTQKQNDLARLANSKLGLNIKFITSSTLPKGKSLKIPGITAPLLTALESKLKHPFVIKPSSKTNDDWVVISTLVQNGTLQIYVPRKRLFSTTTYVFLLIMIGSGIALSVVAFIFMRNQIRPVHRLAIAAEYFGKGLDVKSFKPTGAREVRKAALAFLEMRDRIKRQIKQRTDMLAGVSHDLRTPLTRLKLQLAMLPQNADNQAMQNDISVMEKMIKAYLDFARDETVEYSLCCNIISLLNQSVQDSRKQSFNIHFDATETSLMLTVRPQALQRVFANILDNMRLYAQNGWITVNQLSREIEILFDDDGIGIPENQRENVFKPFHRLDESRNQDIEGTGLGLTIARDIVQTHGGTISLDTSPNGGLRVIIRLPL